MKALYQNYIPQTHTTPATENKKVSLANILALNGLNQREDVQHLQNVVNDLYPTTKNLKALDLGSGQGVAAISLAEMGFEVAAFDMQRSSIAIIQKLAETQSLNISFDIGGVKEIGKLNEKFDLIHDHDCLTKLAMVQDRVQFLKGIKNILAKDGKFILTTEVLNPNFDPVDSFESVWLDANHILWRQTPPSDVPGVMEMNGKCWTAQKRMAPADVIRQEVLAMGFEILDEEIEMPVGGAPGILRMVLA